MTPHRFPLAETCQQHRDAIAFADSQLEVSYVELAAEVQTRAKSFAEQGIGQGVPFAWCPGNDFETLVTFWSLFSLGAIACPISPRFPPEERTAMTRRLGARWGFSCEADPRRAAVKDLPAISPKTLPGPESPTLPQAGGCCSDGVFRSAARVTTFQAAEFDPAAPATITFSSGSTGEPKAIVHSLAAHVASAVGAASVIPLGVGDRWIWSLPNYHVSGMAILVRCTVAGATIHGMHESEALSTELLEVGRITHLSLVPTQLRRLLQEKSFPSSSLKAVLLGGSAVSASLLRKAGDRGVPVHTTYGLTEMASQVTTSEANPRPMTSGRVLPHRELKIDSQGEILVRGATLCAGYVASGKVESVVDEDGWFHTGDLGELNERGELLVSGRRDNMFVSGGENIYPEAIERAMLDLPDIEDAIVVAKADDEFGFRPIAFVRSEDHRASAWSELLRSRLRSFEIPIAFLAFPVELPKGIKPSRAMLSAIANRI